MTTLRSSILALLLVLPACGGSPFGNGDGGEQSRGGDGPTGAGSASGSGSSSAPGGGSSDSSSASPAPATSTSSSSTGGKRIFVTRTQYSGALGGLAGADDRCRISANAAGLGGTWTAWLSSSTTDAPSRIAANGPWHLVGADDVIFASNAALRGYPSKPLDRDEYGAHVYTSGIWTGTLAQGFVGEETCADWTAGTWNDNGVSGDPASTREWTNTYASMPCDFEQSLLCIEQ